MISPNDTSPVFLSLCCAWDEQRTLDSNKWLTCGLHNRRAICSSILWGASWCRRGLELLHALQMFCHDGEPKHSECLRRDHPSKIWVALFFLDNSMKWEPKILWSAWVSWPKDHTIMLPAMALYCSGTDRRPNPLTTRLWVMVFLSTRGGPAQTNDSIFFCIFRKKSKLPAHNICNYIPEEAATVTLAAKDRCRPFILDSLASTFVRTWSSVSVVKIQPQLESPAMEMHVSSPPIAREEDQIPKAEAEALGNESYHCLLPKTL